jgi:hypothetical protein
LGRFLPLDFGTSGDSFVKRLLAEPQCAAGVVEYNLEKGILKHVGIRGTAVLADCDKEHLMRFVSEQTHSATKEVYIDAT